VPVSVDGVPRYHFAVSTGRAGFGTPNGTYQPQRLERTWFSKEYYNSPMPHSIFFHGGYAIHGSYEISRLGGPASHGCIRLHPQNAATLFALVKQQGAGSTTIVVSGQSAAVARRRH
jgi:lipoprotein-anchoring transpeptidase ErfK/SrfK